MMQVPWHRRFQVEIGGRWQVAPSGQRTWRQWLWSPFAVVMWPGKQIDPVRDWPEGLSRAGYLERREPAGRPRDPATGLVPCTWHAKFWWASAALGLLGFDGGLAVMYLPARERSDTGHRDRLDDPLREEPPPSSNTGEPR